MRMDVSDIFGTLEPEARTVLGGLAARTVPKDTVLFRPGDAPAGFLVVLEGCVDVHLVGRSGRDMLLYEVNPGQTCIQTTLCLLGDQSYTGEAVARTALSFVMLPKATFARLMDDSPLFRGVVFRAFGDRLKDVVTVLERVAFVRVEARLASELLRRAEGGDVVAGTHQDFATAIGSVREVVSRRLESFEREGLVRLERGRLIVADRKGLARAAEEPV